MKIKEFCSRSVPETVKNPAVKRVTQNRQKGSDSLETRAWELFLALTFYVYKTHEFLLCLLLVKFISIQCVMHTSLGKLQRESYIPAM